jgi:hypothetical protein
MFPFFGMDVEKQFSSRLIMVSPLARGNRGEREQEVVARLPFSPYTGL